MEQFQRKTLEYMELNAQQLSYGTIYTNKNHPEYGFCSVFEKKNCYSFSIGKYTVPYDFSLPFDVRKTMLRFGNFYSGCSHLQFDGNPLSSNTPSSFFTIESNIKGVQHWHKGDSYYGIEVSVYEPYLRQLTAIDPHFDLLTHFQKDFTYRYLPESIYEVLEKMRRDAVENRLSPLLLESRILECLSLLYAEVSSEKGNGFTEQLNYGKAKIGKNRYINITAADIRCVQQAHEIIRTNVIEPPTIEKLAAQVGISVQKLKVIFRCYYHMTIGEYTAAVRMSNAERLLATTQMSVEDIAHEVGYQQSANFARMFRKTHLQSPAEFRNSKKTSAVIH